MNKKITSLIKPPKVDSGIKEDTKIKMKVVGMFNPCFTDNKVFVKEVMYTINKLQEDGQVVEVQYKPLNLGGGNIMYSALILGRK